MNLYDAIIKIKEASRSITVNLTDEGINSEGAKELALAMKVHFVLP